MLQVAKETEGVIPKGKLDNLLCLCSWVVVELNKYSDHSICLVEPSKLHVFLFVCLFWEHEVLVLSWTKQIDEED